MNKPNSKKMYTPGVHKREEKKAQATLELTLSLICITIFLSAALALFIWFTERMARRQEDFEATRVQAGRIGAGQPGVYVDESNYTQLDFFNETD